MRRVFTLIFCSIIILSTSFTYVKAEDNRPSVTAEGVALMDAATGELIFEQNPDKKLAPASTTKLMTALLVLENTNLDDMVTVGVNPPYADGSRVGIITGEQFTVRDLLAGLLLSSGNDCAIALAEYISGSCEEFASLMNIRAKQLGCTNTNFTNPHGLYEENHYTTARDLTYIMREVIKYQSFLEIEDAYYYEMAPTTIDPNKKWLGNKNQLMLEGSRNYYPYAIAGKTGYTVAARHSYCAAAVKDGVTLISAMINGEGRDVYFPETIQLFDYGYNNFRLVKLWEKNQVVSDLNLYEENIPLIASEDVYKMVKLEDLDTAMNSVSFQLEQRELGNESFEAGTELLKASVYMGDKLIDTIPLLSGTSYEVPDKVIIEQKLAALKPLMIKIVLALAGIAFIIILIRAINISRRKKRIRQARLKRFNKYYK